MQPDTKIEALPDWVRDEIKDPTALRFVEIVYRAIEVWDDIIDRDGRVTDEDVHAAFTAILVELPFNSFLQQHKAALCPMLAVVITAWHAANAMPRDCAENTAHGYTLRKEFINLACMVVGLTRGLHAQRAAAIRGWQDSALNDPLVHYAQGN